MNDTPQWITDRTPDFKDGYSGSTVMIPNKNAKLEWSQVHFSAVKPGEPWAPFPSMPPYVPPAPAYRPWTPEEAIGKVVTCTGSTSQTNYYIISAASPLTVHIEFVGEIAYECLMEKFTQPDGSPCGVEVAS